MGKFGIIKDGGKIAWEWTKEHKAEVITYGIEGIQFMKNFNFFKKKDESKSEEEIASNNDGEIVEEVVKNDDTPEIDNTSRKIDELENIVTLLVGECKFISGRIDEVITDKNNQFSKISTEVEGLKEQIIKEENTFKLLLEENLQLKEKVNKLEADMVSKKVLYTFLGVSLIAVLLSIVSIVL